VTKNAKPTLNRHRAHCSVCAHEKCAEIETGFVNWESPAVRACRPHHSLSTRAPPEPFREAQAKRPLRARAHHREVRRREVTASAVVAAIQAYAKIDPQGHWIERSQNLNLNELFERMSSGELEAYAREGTLPDWFRKTASIPVATAADETEGG
jgi:hypothetical protein